MAYKGEKRVYVAIIAFTAVIAIAMIAVSQPDKSNPDTALYFTNPEKPLVYNAGENTITINFTVENHELREINYRYTVASEYYRNLTILNKETKEGFFILKDNERGNISETLTVQGQSDQVKVSVQLYREGVNEIYRQIRYDIRI